MAARSVNEQSNFRRSISRELWGFFFIAPFLIFYLVFEAYPMLYAIYLSFFDYGIGKSEWIGVQNYLSLFNDAIFIKSTYNTFAFVIGAIPLTLAFALFVATMVIRMSRAAASFFRAAFYLPIVTSSVILSITWAWIYQPVNGVANYVLSFVNLKPVMWLSDTAIALPSLIVILVTWIVGQPIILFLAAIGNIPPTYFEAAQIDGASGGRQFWHITLPLLKPTTLYVILTVTIGAFQTFAIVQLMTAGGPNYATSTIMYLLYATAFQYGDLGKASAMGVILAIMISAVSVIQFKLLKTDIEY